MRKFIVLIAAAGVLGAAGTAAAEQAATAPSGEFIDLKVAVTPPVASTPRTPRGVGVAFDSFSGNRINGNDEMISSSITVRFHSGFRENGAFFPSCKINSSGLTACSKATEIGAGAAEAALLSKNGSAPAFVPAKLTAYNGKPFAGKAPSLIFIASVGGKPAGELDFAVKRQGAGLEFSQIQFPGFPVLFDITKFAITIPDRTVTRTVHGKRVRVQFIDAPTRCSTAWTFTQTNTFAKQPPLTATDSEPCTSR